MTFEIPLIIDVEIDQTGNVENMYLCNTFETIENGNEIMFVINKLIGAEKFHELVSQRMYEAQFEHNGPDRSDEI